MGRKPHPSLPETMPCPGFLPSQVETGPLEGVLLVGGTRMVADTSQTLNCTVCNGLGLRPGTAHECSACEGRKTFPGFDPKALFNSVLTRKQTLRKKFSSDGVDGCRALYVSGRARQYGSPKLLAQSVLVEMAIQGDPYAKHLEALAQVVARQILCADVDDPIDLDLGLAQCWESNVPNFDAMNEKELSSFWDKYHRASRKDAAALVGDRPRCVNIAATLAAYALDRGCAMGLRLEGEIARAMTYEESMELRYKSLPVDIRW